VHPSDVHERVSSIVARLDQLVFIAAVVGAAFALGELAGASPGSFPPPGQIVYSAATPSLGTQSRSLFTARADGTGAVQVTGGSWQDSAPVWSPAGAQIAFSRFDDQDTSLIGGWVINADGTDARQLPGVLSLEAAKWSTDGHWIAYQEQTEFEPQGGEADQSFNLWIVRPDGSGLRKVAQGGASEDGSDLVADGTGWAWSPDGKKLSFVYPGGVRVGVVDIATGKKRVVGAGSYSVWSPDGTKLVLGRGDTSGPSGPQGCGGLWVIPSGGGVRRQIVHRVGVDFTCDIDPAWSPDGRWIAFTRSDANDKIYVVTPDGKHLTRVRPATAGSIKWPSDCARLFFYRTGWIVRGGDGEPRFVSLAQAADADWHC